MFLLVLTIINLCTEFWIMSKNEELYIHGNFVLLTWQQHYSLINCEVMQVTVETGSHSLYRSIYDMCDVTEQNIKSTYEFPLQMGCSEGAFE